MAGTAIRSVEIARALASDVDLTLAVPDGSGPVGGAFAQVRVPSESMLPPLVAIADVVLVAGRAELMTVIRKPLVVDLYDPFIFSDLEFYGEGYTRARGRPLLALRWLQHHLVYGDRFLCASPVQRSFWLGMLAAAGRLNRANYVADNDFSDLLSVVPFGISETPPVHTRQVAKGVIPGIDADDELVLWAGGLWNWFDPLALIRAMHALRERRPRLKALFLGLRHPNPAIGAMTMAERTVALARELGVEGRNVFFLDWVPYEERQNYLLESDVGVSLHQPGVEAQFAFRTRVLDYVWAGLPMLLSRGDELAARVESQRLGRLVPEGDVAAVADGLVAMLDAPPDPDRGARFDALRAELAWSRVVEPLRRFCLHPELAADKRDGAWFATGTAAGEVLRKEDALIAEETLSTERELSPTVGAEYVASGDLVAAYDDLCRVDVLPWVHGTAAKGDLVFSLYTADPDARPVARVSVPLAEVAHNDWQPFDFRPVGNSRGRRYRWVLATTVPDSHVSLWLCATANGAGPQPASMAHYLVKGVTDALPVDPEAFLFLHNATITETLVPGLEATLAPPAADTVAETIRATVSARSRDAETPTAAELARLGAELIVTRRELSDARAHAAELAEAQARAAAMPAGRRFAREVVVAVRALGRFVRWCTALALVLALTVASIPLVVALGIALALTDAAAARRGETPHDADAEPPAPPHPRVGQPVSVVIPSWNGRELLDMSLPPLRAALAEHAPGGEIIVVDNGSQDGTLAHLAATFPDVRTIALPRNEGFAGATNRGVGDARHATVILLNNDMVVEPEFIAPLLEAMDEQPAAFGVSCQIDFIDKWKPRWETGKVHARWNYGTIRLFHLDRYDEDLRYPVFFAGGGASAYDRAKFLALGGFDEAVFSPVYIEDVDLGYRA